MKQKFYQFSEDEIITETDDILTKLTEIKKTNIKIQDLLRILREHLD